MSEIEEGAPVVSHDELPDLTRGSAPENPGRRRFLKLLGLGGAAVIANKILGNPAGETITDLRNAVVRESEPLVVQRREDTVYDMAIRPFTQPNHRNIEAKFYKSPYAEEDEALSKEELAELGVKLDVQGNVFAQRGRKVEGRAFTQFPGTNETKNVNGENKTVGRWAQVQLSNGKSVFVPEQFIEYGNPAPNVAQPQQ